MKEFCTDKLRSIIRYDQSTGKLYWLFRPVELFATEKAFSLWNGKWANREGFTYTGKNGYKQGKMLGYVYTGHRVAWALHYGEWPNGQVDHINGIRTDNRISNLRLSDNARNQMNRAAVGSSEYLGVSYYKRRGVWE